MAQLHHIEVDNSQRDLTEVQHNTRDVEHLNILNSLKIDPRQKIQDCK